MKKRLCALCLALVLVLSPALAAEEGQFPVLWEYQGFDDVATGAWYAPYVQTCYETGLLSGTGGGRFEPQRNVSLGEALVLAARIHYRLHGGTGDLPEGPAPEEFFRQSGETRSDAPAAFAYFSSLYPSAAWNALCYFSGPIKAGPVL